MSDQVSFCLLSYLYIFHFIFQFVPFRDFIRNGTSMPTSQAALAKEVLEEIPEQFLQYMKKRGIKPKPRTTAPPM